MTEPAASPRYRFVDCQGRRVLRIDYRGLSPEQHIRALDPVREFITRQPPRSLLVMTLANDGFTASSADAIKHHASCIDPHVRANAIVCRPGFRVAFNAMLNVQLLHEIRCFESEGEAGAWLAVSAERPQTS